MRSLPWYCCCCCPGADKKVVEEDTQGAKGAGFISKYRNKPNKRVVKVSPEEKMKNRLRLVASQVKAVNDNPKIILELNALYEKLYNYWYYYF